MHSGFIEPYVTALTLVRLKPMQPLISRKIPVRRSGEIHVSGETVVNNLRGVSVQPTLAYETMFTNGMRGNTSHVITVFIIA